MNFRLVKHQLDKTCSLREGFRFFTSKVLEETSEMMEAGKNHLNIAYDLLQDH